MKRVHMIFFALAVIFSLSCISLMAEEDRTEYSGVEQTPGAVEKDSDWNEPTAVSYSRLVSELERQREEIRALREEVRSLREEILQLLITQLDRQWEEVKSLRMMQEHQYEFLQGMLKEEHNLRTRQFAEMREREPEWGRDKDKFEGEFNIGKELMHLQEQVELNPRDPELRMKLGHIYQEVDNIDAAFGQYKAALEVAPDFEPAFHALEELRMKFPDMSRKPAEKPLEDAAGEVISANKEEVKVAVFEGDAMTFKVPFIQNEEGAWVLNGDLSEYTGTLEPGMRVRIIWQQMEDRMVIRRIERMEDEE